MLAHIALIYDLVRIDRLVFVELRQAPTVTALGALRVELAAAREAAARPLVLVARIPPDAEPVSDAMRAHMAAYGRYVAPLCAEIHMVVETPGFRGAILRSAITASALLSRERNLTVHRRLAYALDAARQRLEREWHADVDALLAAHPSAA
jgi:hypothetical protein